MASTPADLGNTPDHSSLGDDWVDVDGPGSELPEEQDDLFEPECFDIEIDSRGIKNPGGKKMITTQECSGLNKILARETNVTEPDCANISPEGLKKELGRHIEGFQVFYDNLYELKGIVKNITEGGGNPISESGAFKIQCSCINMQYRIQKVHRSGYNSVLSWQPRRDGGEELKEQEKDRQLLEVATFHYEMGEWCKSFLNDVLDLKKLVMQLQAYSKASWSSDDAEADFAMKFAEFTTMKKTKAQVDKNEHSDSEDDMGPWILMAPRPANKNVGVNGGKEDLDGADDRGNFQSLCAMFARRINIGTNSMDDDP